LLDLFSIDRYREFSTGSDATCPDFYEWDALLKKEPDDRSLKFRVFKFMLDKVAALMVLPIVACLSLVFLLINPIANPGSESARPQRAFGD